MGKLCFAVGLTGILRVFGYMTEPLLDRHEIHAVTGEPTRVVNMVPPVDELKIVTWNIERGNAYASILSALRRLNPDILLLQEVDRDCRRTGYRDVARDLAHELGMNWVSAGEFQEIGEARGKKPAITGQATLSKFPIDSAEVLRFTAQDRWRWNINPVQPRRGGRMALRSHTAGILVYNTHIESGGNDTLKRRQIAEIVDSQPVDATDHGPTVIGGDFNNGPLIRSSMFGSLSSAEFADALGDLAHRGPTSFGQGHPIDWIFAKHLTPLQGRVVEVLDASDHFPVMAEFTFSAALAAQR